MHGTAPSILTSGRDIRLDLFRGLALWFIFLDHVPDNIVSWLTVRNYGFSDATEIFVYISGYTAVIAYARMMLREGWFRAAARIYRRVWQLYVAHILLFVAFTAQIAWLSTARNMPALIEEMQLLGLGDNPYRAIFEAVLLKFRPVNLDVLPLYIFLLATFPLVLPAVVRWPKWVIAVSIAVYAASCRFDWNLPGYPEPKVWFFNPLAWQVLFHVGAAMAVLGPELARLDRWKVPISIAAGLYLLFAAFIALSWQHNSLERLVPELVARYIYPIDKTNVDTLRIFHFLAIAWFVRLLVPKDAAFLKWPLFLPIRRCGEHSLQVFCVGTFLALSAQVVDSQYDGVIVAQIVVSIVGIAIMCAVAYGARWFRSDARPGGPRLRLRDLLLASTLAILLSSTAALAQKHGCRASNQLLDLGNPLEIARQAVADKKELRVVAMGSSSTQGYGATNPAYSYPAQLKLKLDEAMPGVAVHVFNKGIGGQDAEEMTARMRNDVSPEHAQLVIWQVGTNSAIRRFPLDKFADRLRAGIDIGKSLGAEFVLMNLQYVPAIVALPDEEEYARVMADVAKEKKTGLFKRFEIMRSWYNDGMPYAQFVTNDGLHLNDFGQKCIGMLLARSILNTVQPAQLTGAPKPRN